MRMLAVLLLSLVASGLACNITLPQVTTIHGIVEGICLQASPEVNGFLGIPYAAPPVGDLRLEEPIPPLNWSGVLETKTQPNACPQNTTRPNSEDCLYLNVFSPATPSSIPAGYPVMVVIHGGGFQYGTALESGSTGIAKTLVSRGVVVVVIQYRLGLLGWCTMGDNVLPGNLGLWDQTRALEWINQNIGAFGGNKDSVTLFGGSAGAASNEALNLSPHSNHLFHRAITFSGLDRDTYRSNSTSACINLAKANGLTWTDSSDLKAQLKAAPLNGLKPIVGSKFFPDSFDFLKLDWVPNMDGDFFAQDHTVLRKVAPNKPRMMGSAYMEGVTFTSNFNITWELLDELLEYYAPQGFPARNQIISWYRDQYKSEAYADEPTAAAKHASLSAFGERTFVSGIVDGKDNLLKLHGFNANVFLYVFKQFNPASVGANFPFRSFAGHVSEQWYVLGSNSWTLSPDDIIVQKFIARAVANFVKTGNPNGSGSTALPVKWQPVTPLNRNRNLEITVTPTMKSSYFNNRLSISNEIGHLMGTIII